MNNLALRESVQWSRCIAADSETWSLEEDDRLELFVDNRASLLKPSRSYSKRSSYIQELRSHSKWATGNACEDLTSPTREAQSAAEDFINRLPEGCLNFNLAVSHSGEINFFFGNKRAPFQVLIDESGLASYYGVLEGRELEGSDLPTADVPYVKLLQFVDQHK